MTNAMIEAVGLHKSFGETHALRGLDLDAKEGTILCVLGPNGAGKTTASTSSATPTWFARRSAWPVSTPRSTSC